MNGKVEENGSWWADWVGVGGTFCFGCIRGRCAGLVMRRSFGREFGGGAVVGGLTSGS